MENNTFSGVSNQASSPRIIDTRTIRVPTKIAICKELEPLQRKIIGALCDFASSPQDSSQRNKLTCGYHYLVKNYGYSKDTIRAAIGAAKKAGYMEGEVGNLSFIDLDKIWSVEREDFPHLTDEEFKQAAIPNYIEILPVISQDESLQHLMKFTHGFLHYKTFEDGEVFLSVSLLAKVMGESKQRISYHVTKLADRNYVEKRTEKGKATRIMSILGNNKVYQTAFENYEKGAKFHYHDEELSTVKIGGDKIQDRDMQNTGSEPSKYRIDTTYINNTKLDPKAPKVAKSKIDKKKAEEKDNDDEHDYVPDWRKTPRATTSTVLEYNSPEYKQRELERQALADASRKRGEEQMRAFLASKSSEEGRDTIETKSAQRKPHAALQQLGAMLGAKLGNYDKSGDNDAQR